MSETLTKENFWNEMEQKYPKAMKHFKQWIDQYKIEHDWNGLFNADFIKFTKEQQEADDLVQRIISSVIPKYHELPIAMQFGIFLQYVYSYYTKYNLFNPDKPGVELYYNEYTKMAKHTIVEVLSWLEGRL